MHFLVFLLVLSQIDFTFAICGNKTQVYFEADPDDKCRYYQCEKGAVNRLSCSNMQWSQERQECVTLDLGETCQPNAVCEDKTAAFFLPDLSSKCRYYHCAFGVESSLACPMRQRWSQSLQKCVPLAIGETCRPEIKPICAGRDLTTCAQRSTYECTTDEMLTACPHKCKLCPPLKTTTAKPTTTTTTTTTKAPEPRIPTKPTTTTTIKPDVEAAAAVKSVETKVCSKNETTKLYFMADPNDKCRYYKCQQGLANRMACRNMQWSQEEEDCVFLDAGETCQPSAVCEDKLSAYILPDIDNRCRYYQCTLGLESNLWCPLGQRWDMDQEKCVPLALREGCRPMDDVPHCGNPDQAHCAQKSPNQCKFSWMRYQCSHKCKLCKL